MPNPPAPVGLVLPPPDARPAGAPVVPAWLARRRTAPGSHADVRVRSGHIGGLDGLRGIAALTVVLSHMSNRGLVLMPGLDVGGAGKSGVWLFFVLSAFLLLTQMLSWSRERLSDGRSWADYLVGRAVRILPLFLLVCGVCWATTSVGFGVPVPMTAEDFLATVLLQQGDLILWTIPVEFKVYFVLPLVAVAVRVLSVRSPWIGVAALVAAAVVAFGTIEPATGGTDSYRFAGIFLVGGAAAAATAALQARTLSVGTRRLFEVAAWVAGAALVLLLPSVVRVLTGGRVGVEDLHRMQWLFAGLDAVLIVGMVLGPGLLRQLLDTRPLVFLGRISYSLYLWHLVPVHIAVAMGLDSALAAWAVVGVAMAMSWASFQWIEAPTLRAGARLRRRIRRDRRAHPVGSGAGGGVR